MPHVPASPSLEELAMALQSDFLRPVDRCYALERGLDVTKNPRYTFNICNQAEFVFQILEHAIQEGHAPSVVLWPWQGGASTLTSA